VSRTRGLVRVVGAGLIGTSVGLALSKLGLDVAIEDISPANQALAIDYGAGRKPLAEDNPGLVVVCVPPDLTAKTVLAELARYPEATLTDVASVKLNVLNELIALNADMTRYVGSHPMAGRERGGALAGRADLFFGRPWVISPNQQSLPERVQSVEQLALDLGAIPSTVEAADHDRAVAVVSHLPQVVSSLLAAQLGSAPVADLSLSGQGLRDTTRIAASDAKLWMQILSANAEPVSRALDGFAKDLARVQQALADIHSPGALSELGEVLTRANRGAALIPGKHGNAPKSYSQIVVMIDDKPGQLAKLLTEIGEIGINLEDLKLEHSPGAQIGLVELYVLPEVEKTLAEALADRNWRISG